MAKSPTYMMMPRNKTGIFASEFQNYSNANKYVKYTANYHYNFVKGAAAADAGQKRLTQFDESQCLAYRKHSAFKIRVKPRQVMSAVNTKLIEQRSRPQSRTLLMRSQTSRTKSGASSARIDIVSNESEKTESSVNNDAAHDYESSSVRDESADNFTSTKDVFRPSTVKTAAAATRRPPMREKPGGATMTSTRNVETNATQPPQPPVINLRILSSKSSNTIVEQHPMVRRKANNNTPMSLSTPSLVAVNREDKPVTAIHYVNLNSENSILGTGPPMYNHNLSTSQHHHHHHQQQQQSLNPKASYNSISSSSTCMSSLNYQPAAQAARTDHSNTLKASNLLNSIKISTESTSAFDASSNLLIRNLNEEDFVKLLKEYRQTKTISLSSLMPKNDQASSDHGHHRIPTPNLGSPSRRLLSSRNLDLSTPSRSQLFPSAPLPSKMDTLTLPNEDGSSYQLSSRVPAKSAQSYSIESQKNILRANLENPNNRAPKFFVNYINNRFETKNQYSSDAERPVITNRPMTTKSAGSKVSRLAPRYEKSASELTNPRLHDRALGTPRYLASTKNVSLDDFGDGSDTHDASDSNMISSARLNKIRSFNFPDMADL